MAPWSIRSGDLPLVDSSNIVNIHVEERNDMSLQFDATYYLEQNPDVAAAVEQGLLTAEEHWELYGAEEQRNPNANFVTSEYLAANPDVAASDMNPLTHFLTYGASEGRAPSAAYEAVSEGFDEADYLAANADVAAAVEAGDFESGYEHWVKYGQFEDARPEATVNGGTPVSEVIGGEEPASALTEALAALQGAEKAYVDYLTTDAATAEVFAEYVEDNSVDVEDAEAVATALGNFFGTGTGTTGTDVVGKLNDEIDDVASSVDTERSDAYNNAIIEEERAENTEELNAAQKAVDEVEGLDAAVSAYNSAQSAYQDAIEAKVETAADLDGQFARVDTLDNSTTGTQKTGVNYPATAAEIKALIDAEAVATVVEDGSNDALIQINAEGELVVADRAKDFDGMNQLLAAVQADFDAIEAKDAAESTFQSAIADVLDAENEDGIDVTLDDDTSGGTVNVEQGTATTGADTLYVNGAGELFLVKEAADDNDVYKVTDITIDALTAKDAVTEVTVTIDPDNAFATGVSDTDLGNGYTAVDGAQSATVQATGEEVADVSGLYYSAADGKATADLATDAPLSDRLSDAITAEEDFEEAVQTYLAAKELVDQEDELDTAVTEAREAIENDEEDGGLGVTLLDLGDNLTTGDDLVLFEDAKGTTETIANFGASGEDKIYFGSDFELVALGDDEIGERVGAADQLEVFWEQDGNDLVLYVEADAEAGRETVTDNLTEVVLTGVSSDDIDFSGGFLSAGTAA